jgi:hypothetical protein
MLKLTTEEALGAFLIIVGLCSLIALYLFAEW